MRTESAVPSLLLVAVALLQAAIARAQVDEEWLRTWQEAQKHRPPVLDSVGRIAPSGEPGTPLVLEGQVVEPDGATPAAAVMVFAYHTDRDGLYSRPGEERWCFRGWVRTDEEGRFRLRTIRPAPYPSRSEPAHVHVTLESPLHGRQWTRSILFADDPLVSAEARRRSAAAGRFGNVREVTMRDGVAHVRAFFKLKSVPDF
jgi:protocatechuate 3,4-dioxygenase beta subunit